MYIKKQIKDNTAIITIDREEALNALKPEVLHELKKKIDGLINDKNISSIILTGSGEKAFIAGADIKFMKSLDKKGALEFGKLGHEVANILENSPKPIIAAVNGFALGGGCEISLACHIRYASENAIFSQPEVKLGLIPGMGGTQRLPKIVGKGNAVELIISGKMIDADEALRIGLVSKVFPNNLLLDETVKFANSLSLNGSNAISSSINCINQSYERSHSDGLNNEVEVFSKLFGTKETSEGLRAFIEKRKANFNK